jgi:DNA-binding Lrp family transcriptional regulator
MNNFSKILSKVDSSVINEETAKEITEAFEAAVQEKATARVQLELESALSKQDEDHATKLQKLLEAIDTDHTEKLQKVVSAITENHTEKLKNLVSFYRKALNEKAESFSNKIVGEISNYLDIYLEKVVPTIQLEEAVSNTYARKKLAQIREMVGIDPETVNDQVKGLVAEGKKKIDELNQKLNEAYKENHEILTKLKFSETSNILEQKTKGMPFAKKEFINNLLSDKDSSYIEENFKYVVEMFERSEEEKATDLVEEAKQNAISRSAKVPSRKTVVEESKAAEAAAEQYAPVSGYLSELKKY